MAHEPDRQLNGFREMALAEYLRHLVGGSYQRAETNTREVSLLIQGQLFDDVTVRRI